MSSAEHRHEPSTARRGLADTYSNIRGWPAQSNRGRLSGAPEPRAVGRQTPMWPIRRREVPVPTPLGAAHRTHEDLIVGHHRPDDHCTLRVFLRPDCNFPEIAQVTQGVGIRISPLPFSFMASSFLAPVSLYVFPNRHSFTMRGGASPSPAPSLKPKEPLRHLAAGQMRMSWWYSRPQQPGNSHVIKALR